MRNKTVGLLRLVLLCGTLLILTGRADGQAGIITNPSRGQLIISEFRLRGPGGENDEFVEVYNTTTSTIRVVDQSSDPGYQGLCALTSSCGWALTDLSNIVGGSPKFIIPNTTEIPPHGHYLITNNGEGGYSLSSYATADGSYTSGVGSVMDISDGTGIAIFKTADTRAFDGSNACLGGVGGVSCVLDGVGFSNNAAPYREGTGLPVIADANVEHSYVRKVGTTGFPQDTNINADDFWLVAPDPTTISSATAVLGAPGPENTNSPVNQTSQMKSSLLNPILSSTASPNQVRNSTPGTPGTPTAFGTLTLRRVFKNTTGGSVTRVRLRITNISTTNSPGAGTAQADVRMLTSIAETITVNGNPVDVRKVTLEEPPTQAKGGGYNASLVFDLPGGTLADQGSVAINITMGVAKGGTYRLAYIVEAAP
jgi:hypothetical protein